MTTCTYDYLAIFSEYGEAVHTMLTGVWQPASPFPAYASIADYETNVTECFKGIVVWDAQRYYYSADMQPVDSTNDSVCDDVVGFFIVPTFGTVSIINNREFQQRITFIFDSNTNADADPFGTNIIKYIDWFVNTNYALVNIDYADPNESGYFKLENNRRLYIALESISEPIYTPDSVYVRRAVNLVLRYCHCG